MYYYCPHCTSMRKPIIIKYFPPITVKCLECGYMNLEYKFIRDVEKQKTTPLHYVH